jgi:hypothetical protein
VPNRAKGVPARFVSVRPATAAKASSEGWRLCLRPNIAHGPAQPYAHAQAPLPPPCAPLPHSVFLVQSNLPLPLFHLSPCPRVDRSERLLPSVEPVVSSLSPLSPLSLLPSSPCMRAPVGAAPARRAWPPAPARSGTVRAALARVVVF